MVDYILLGFLMYQEMTGYDLKKFMEHSTANFYDASFGSIYPALARLSKKGWVEKWEDSATGKLKKYYRLLPAGREAFLAWLDQPIPQASCCQELLLRVFFLGHLPEKRASFRLMEYQEGLHQEISKLQQLAESLHPAADIYQRGTLDFGIDYYQYVIGWCSDLLARQKKGPEDGSGLTLPTKNK